MGELDFLAVGDITTDTFIRLKGASVACDANGTDCTLSIPWGAKIAYESAEDVSAAGNVGNAAICAARLGLHAGLLSMTGTDRFGDQNMSILKENNVDTSLVAQVEGVPSNHDYVLWYEGERTILRKYSIFPHKMPSGTPPPFVYLSSLENETGEAYAAFLHWLNTHPETKLVFQPGRELTMPHEMMDPLYKRSYLSICNKEEAEQVLGLASGQDIKDLLVKFAAFGPSIVAITDGPRGGYAYDGSRMLRVPMYPDPKAPLERTGAGDAFASTVAVALALGKPLDEALLWGPINAMAVVQKIGGHEGLLTRTELETLLAAAPPEYKLETL